VGLSGTVLRVNM